MTSFVRQAMSEVEFQFSSTPSFKKYHDQIAKVVTWKEGVDLILSYLVPFWCRQPKLVSLPGFVGLHTPALCVVPISSGWMYTTSPSLSWTMNIRTSFNSFELHKISCLGEQYYHFAMEQRDTIAVCKDNQLEIWNVNQKTKLASHALEIHDKYSAFQTQLFHIPDLKLVITCTKTRTTIYDYTNKNQMSLDWTCEKILGNEIFVHYSISSHDITLVYSDSTIIIRQQDKRTQHFNCRQLCFAWNIYYNGNGEFVDKTSRVGWKVTQLHRLNTITVDIKYKDFAVVRKMEFCGGVAHVFPREESDIVIVPGFNNQVALLLFDGLDSSLFILTSHKA